MLDATNLLADSAGRVHVTLRAYTTFLVRWLIPQLPDFHAQHPDVELHLTTAFDPVDFNRDSVDLGVRYGHGNWPGLDATLLFNDEMVWSVIRPSNSGSPRSPLRRRWRQSRISFIRCGSTIGPTGWKQPA